MRNAEWKTEDVTAAASHCLPFRIPHSAFRIHEMFVDRVTLFVRGGDGGNGIVSFRREKYAPRGGPNGGDGGAGGHVLLRAVEGLTNLAHLSHQRHWIAARGEHGQGSNCTGRAADDLLI